MAVVCIVRTTQSSFAIWPVARKPPPQDRKNGHRELYEDILLAMLHCPVPEGTPLTNELMECVLGNCVQCGIDAFMECMVCPLVKAARGTFSYRAYGNVTRGVSDVVELTEHTAPVLHAVAHK